MACGWKAVQTLELLWLSIPVSRMAKRTTRAPPCLHLIHLAMLAAIPTFRGSQSTPYAL